MSAQQHLSLQLVPESKASGMNVRDLLMLGTLRAPAFESKVKRPPLQLCAVIDQSGSMQGPKIELVREATTFIATQLTENDSMSIVTYNNDAVLAFPRQKMTPTNKERIFDCIKNIRANGGTNICLGLIEGLDTLEKDVTRDTVTSTLLLTDGQANDGPTTAEAIVGAIPEGYSGHSHSSPIGYGSPFRAQQPMDTNKKIGAPKNGGKRVIQGSVNTFGFGNDHDATLLTTLARKAEGVYYYVPGTNDIGPIFANVLGGLTTVFALKVKIRFEGLNGCTIQKAHTRYTERKDPEGKFIELDIPDVQGQERKDVVLSIRLPETIQDGRQPYVRMRVTYFNTLSEEEETVTQDISIYRCENPITEPVPAELDIERNRIKAAEAMEEATKLGDEGKMNQAVKRITDAINEITISPTAKETVNQGLLEDLNRATVNFSTVEAYRYGGQQIAQTTCSSHWAQRQTSNSDRGQARYETSARSDMRRRFDSFSSERK
ncbi:hypothetical protein PROFUN_01577 [Planoprotostelium fungivorum]|uniref:VWFA domain-containing protein n=1 Tax=Planoprotostelium fungivorum TaxID=1890364 RepID=A0A2P6NTL5_9EUKA|nr:hypothetical protein PROFUN_01577 [Planoprotostelium fungivorum]